MNTGNFMFIWTLIFLPETYRIIYTNRMLTEHSCMQDDEEVRLTVLQLKQCFALPSEDNYENHVQLPLRVVGSSSSQ